MSQAANTINVPVLGKSEGAPRRFAFVEYLPAFLPIVAAFALWAVRKSGGPGATPNDGTLIVWALLAYIFAAASLLVNFWAPVPFLKKLGVWTAAFGLFANLASWLVRWVTLGEAENWKRMTDAITGEYHPTWFFSYIPFVNLYDLSVAFAFGAAFVTLLWSRRANTQFVGALTFPLITLILILAVFIGNTVTSLPPVLDSYWRPIHVGVASLSYGTALVSFAIAVMYLLKDGVKIEAMGVAVGVFVLSSFFIFSNSYSLFGMTYKLSPMIKGMNSEITPLRVPVPGVAAILTIGLSLLLLGTIAFALKQYRHHESAGRIGHWLWRASLAVQGLGLVWLFYQIKAVGNVSAQIGQDQYRGLGKWLAGEQAAQMPVEQMVQGAANWMAQRGGEMFLSTRSNPVEIASLLTAFAATLFIVLFSFQTEKIRAALPKLERIDQMVYKTVGVAFAGLAILLVTGAVWANESWGRYWDWDAKETGALVAWLAYAGYLHTRIAHGWTGRRSAYFALVGFLLVIFTYLGVSYLLPGLHSYAAAGL
jgi:ABC-type transport system involved in cytochrome c biogenesis permease subunit